MIRISGAESQLMEILWRHGPTSGEQLIAEAKAANDWSDGTIRTLVARLLRKKAIRSRKDGKSAIYQPILARADYLVDESQGLLDRLFDGEVAPMVAHLAEHRQLGAKDLQRLKALIRKLEKEDE
jgi:BlaI family penicillinase repressor